VSAGWVAATTRGRALTRRLVGIDGARALAASSWPDARTSLASTFYGVDLPADSDRRTVGRHAVEATIWQLRVIAGWLPPDQGALPRLFAAPMEIANIEARFDQLTGRDVEPPFRLGSLAVAWPRVAAAGSLDQLRHTLATSVWGEPGGAERADVALGLRVAWARRLAGRVPEAALWAKGAVAVLAAREIFAFDRGINEATRREIDAMVGRHWRTASSLDTFVDELPASASWPLLDLTDPTELWRAEIAVANRVDVDAARHVGSGLYDRAAVAGIMAMLLIDLWRVRGAIEVAGRTPIPEEFFDAVA
jgi:hypothetical protein